MRSREGRLRRGGLALGGLLGLAAMAGAVSAAPAFEPVVVPEPTETALQYYRSGMWLWGFGLVWGFAIPLLLLFTGVSAKLRDVAARWSGDRWYPTVAIYIALFTLLMFVIDLPLSFYSGFLRQHAYELSNQPLAKWFGDALKGLGVAIVGGAAFLWVPYLLLRKSPRRWWLYTALLTVPFLLFVQLITPIWISPLFNDFGPMKDAELEAEILSLAQQAGIDGGRVFEVEMSVDTKRVNAYVNGFMATKRIVLWDTLLAKLDRDEVLFVMGHEMGHYVLDHVVKAIAMVSLLVAAALYAIHRIADGLIRRNADSFGFDHLSDVASYPLLVVLFSAAFLLVGPLANTMSRHFEHEADRFGLELTRDNRAAGEAFVKLQQENLSNPRPGWIYMLWRGSHPSLGDRVDFTNAYRPWETGEPLVYGDAFAAPAPRDEP